MATAENSIQTSGTELFIYKSVFKQLADIVSEHHPQEYCRIISELDTGPVVTLNGLAHVGYLAGQDENINAKTKRDIAEMVGDVTALMSEMLKQQNRADYLEGVIEGRV